MITGEESAYPLAQEWQNQFAQEWHSRMHGLTKREHFASMAMQAIVNSTLINTDTMESVNRLSKQQGKDPANIIALMSVEYADALIDELNKSRDEQS